MPKTPRDPEARVAELLERLDEKIREANAACSALNDARRRVREMIATEIGETVNQKLTEMYAGLNAQIDLSTREIREGVRVATERQAEEIREAIIQMIVTGRSAWLGPEETWARRLNPDVRMALAKFLLEHDQSILERQDDK